MNIEHFLKFKMRILVYQTLYVFLILLILVGIIVFMNLFQNTKELEYIGKVDNNILYLENLLEKDIYFINKSREMVIQNKAVRKEIIGINEMNNQYLVRLQLDNYHEQDESLKVRFIVKKESLYQFIVKTMKGEN